MTIQDKAREALEWFESVARDDGTTYIRTKDGRPEWVQDLVFTAHGGEFLPEDWRYQKIMEALEYIANTDSDPIDEAGEFADNAVDVYTMARLQWFASNLNRPAYCDEAMSEFGIHPDADDFSIVSLIGWGQYYELYEVYGLVLSELEKYAEAE